MKNTKPFHERNDVSCEKPANGTFTTEEVIRYLHNPSR